MSSPENSTSSERATRGTLAELTPSVGFPLTVCVACYGTQATLTRRFLSTLYRRTDPTLFRLRAGLNEVESSTLEEFQKFAAHFGNIELFIEPRNLFKCPLMRKLFYAPPLTSRWTLWCDDDTYFVRSDWLNHLAARMESAPEVAMWGQVWALDFPDPGVESWVRKAPWYRGVPFLQSNADSGRGHPRFVFATGGFWALRTEVLQALDWPDRRLIQAGDDCLLGEALRQNNYRLARFDYGVRINDAPRRNVAALEVNRFLAPP